MNNMIIIGNSTSFLLEIRIELFEKHLIPSNFIFISAQVTCITSSIVAGLHIIFMLDYVV